MHVNGDGFTGYEERCVSRSSEFMARSGERQEVDPHPDHVARGVTRRYSSLRRLCTGMVRTVDIPSHFQRDVFVPGHANSPGDEQ
jgi:hypothetical protein